MPRLKEWRFALGWLGWRKAINGDRKSAYNILEKHGRTEFTVRIEMVEGGKGYRDLGRTMHLEMTEDEARALARSINERLAYLERAAKL